LVSDKKNANTLKASRKAGITKQQVARQSFKGTENVVSTAEVGITHKFETVGLRPNAFSSHFFLSCCSRQLFCPAVIQMRENSEINPLTEAVIGHHRTEKAEITKRKG
jgi:hypothetical protein